MLRNDPSALHARQIDVLEQLRELLCALEQEEELSVQLHEQVRAARLRADREIETLR